MIRNSKLAAIVACCAIVAAPAFASTPKGGQMRHHQYFAREALVARAQECRRKFDKLRRLAAKVEHEGLGQFLPQPRLSAFAVRLQRQIARAARRRAEML